jgi:replicative DNA helicase
MASLYAPEVEGNALALLLQDPSVWGDFYLINRDDWSKAHQPLWDVIAQQLNQTPPGSVTPMMLAERLRGFGVVLEGGFDPYEYLQGLTTRYVEKKEAPHLARELKRLTVRRELVGKMDAARKELVATPNATFESMAALVEKALTSVTTEYYRPEVTEVLGEHIIEVVEKRAEKPLTAEESGYLGPFKSINETIGPLSYRGSYTVVGSRSGGGKSSLAWFYQTYLAEKFDLPILHCDAAEMTVEELQWRAVCAMSEGEIPYWAVFRGQWKNNPRWASLVRDKIWPRVRKLRVYYKNMGVMSPQERIAFIRRFYYQKVGRGSHLLINDDYLKAVQSFNREAKEHQMLGNYVNDQKSLITEEIEASIWTGLQLNQSGIVTGKKEADLNDSEGAFSLSDRILQQSTHSLLLRYKVTEQLAREKNLFGNVCAIPLKKRQLLGERYQEMLLPIKMPNGKFVQNAVNLETKGFWYRDCGTTAEMLKVLGQGVVDMATSEQPQTQPL